jgi:hypothetical protein
VDIIVLAKYVASIFILKLEAELSSETLISTDKSTQYGNSEDCNLYV